MLFEDSAALLGLFIAMLGIWLTQVTGNPVPPGSPLDNTELIIVQTPALLRLTAVPDSIVLSQNQSFTLTAELTNLGQASIGAGQLQLTLPPNYSTTDSTLRSIVLDDTVNWSIDGVNLTSGPGYDDIQVNFSQVPLDSNYFDLAAIEPGSDTIFTYARVDTLAGDFSLRCDLESKVPRFNID